MGLLRDMFSRVFARKEAKKKQDAARPPVKQQGRALEPDADPEGVLQKLYARYKKAKRKAGERAARYRRFVAGGVDKRPNGPVKEAGLYFRTIRYFGTFRAVPRLVMRTDVSAGGDIFRERVSGKEQTRERVRHVNRMWHRGNAPSNARKTPPIPLSERRKELNVGQETDIRVRAYERMNQRTSEYWKTRRPVKDIPIAG